MGLKRTKVTATLQKKAPVLILEGRCSERSDFRNFRSQNEVGGNQQRERIQLQCTGYSPFGAAGG